ncbi:SIS domain-containing protein [Kitasatospora sp. NPDC048194]|uniref:D-sedoheptulose-7-phosphate isomerase n=1 Tax=Kitasatospora sp. NPDC048194 TaxID=3364045 RepID=UPI00371D2965
MPSDQLSGPGQLDAYLTSLHRALSRLDRAAVARYAQALVGARADGRRVFVFGNGGSSSIASHHVADLVKTAAVAGAAPLAAFCLSDNTPLVTAISNDIAYEECFAYQLAAYAGPGDVAVAISCSGTSPNVVLAARAAVDRGMLLVALTGDTAQGAAALADIHVRVAASNYGVIEDVHHSVAHAASQLLRTAVEQEQAAGGGVPPAGGVPDDPTGLLGLPALPGLLPSR